MSDPTTANPLDDITEAVAIALRDTPGAMDVNAYDGQMASEDEWEAFRRRIALKGTEIFVRISRTTTDETAPEYLDCQVIDLHLLIGAKAAADPETSTRRCMQLAWKAYLQLAAAGTTPAWMHTRWRLKGFVMEHQDRDIAVISVILSANCDFTDWEAAS